MNRTAGERRTNRRYRAGIFRGGVGCWGGWPRRAFLRAFRLGLRCGFGRRGSLGGGWPGGQSFGGRRLRGFLLAGLRHVGFVGNIIGNVVPVQAAKPYGGVLVD
jgi:hypothetical protein